MGRSVYNVACNLPPEQIQQIVTNFYQVNGFEPYNYNNEMWYKKGKGIATGPQVMRTLVYSGTVVIEAFTQFAVLPGVYSGENELDGFVGAIPNQALKSKINNLILMLGQPMAQQPVMQQPVQQVMPQQTQQVYQQPVAQQPMMQQPVMQQQAVPQVTQQPMIQQQPVMQQQPTMQQPVQQPAFRCAICGNPVTQADVFCGSCGQRLK